MYFTNSYLLKQMILSIFCPFLNDLSYYKHHLVTCAGSCSAVMASGRGRNVSPYTPVINGSEFLGFIIFVISFLAFVFLSAGFLCWWVSGWKQTSSTVLVCCFSSVMNLETR